MIEPYNHQKALQTWKNSGKPTIYLESAAIVRYDKIYSNYDHDTVMDEVWQDAKLSDQKTILDREKGFRCEFSTPDGETHVVFALRKPATRLAKKSGQLPKDFKGLITSWDLHNPVRD